MTLKEKLDLILKEAGFTGQKRTFRCSTYDWDFRQTESQPENVIDKLLKELADISGKRVAEIRTTIIELLLNSNISCGHREDIFLECELYKGDGCIISYIKDDGPGFDHEAEIAKRREFIENAQDIQYLDRGAIPPGNGLDNGGTGLYCLLRFANSFTYSDKGNELIVRFDF